MRGPQLCGPFARQPGDLELIQSNHAEVVRILEAREVDSTRCSRTFGICHG